MSDPPAEAARLNATGAGGENGPDGTFVKAVAPDETATLFRESNGELVERPLPDNTIVTRYDAEGRPVAGVVTGADGTSSHAVTITYDADGTGVWTYVDPTQIHSNPLGDVVEQVTADGWRYYYQGDTPVRAISPDGWTFTTFNGSGQPTVASNNTMSATITYTAEGSVWTMSDGTVVTRNHDGAAVSMTSPDGSVFTSFDAAGRPVAGTVPGEDGAPVPVTIQYLGDGSSVWTTEDGDQTVLEADGDVVRQTVDGWTFTNFTEDGHPLSADNGDMHADISYPGDGTAVWKYGDGTVVTRGGSGQVLQMVTPEGWTFTSFDPTGRPVKGAKGDENVTIAYQGDGSRVLTYGDGTTVTENSSGETTKVTTPEGWVFTSFDSHGNPLAGKNGDQSATIAYNYSSNGALASSVWAFDDGTTVHRDGEGTITKMVTPDGWTFTTFDDQGRPTSGHQDATADHPAVDASISYDANGNSVWDLGAGQPTLTYDKDGNLLTMVTPDGWTFDKFDADGNPVHGHNDELNLDVDVYRFPDGSVEWDFSDGSTLITDANGAPLEQVIPDGKGGFYDIVFSVDLPILKDAVDWTTYTQGEIVTAFGNLKKKVATVHESWESPASREYEAMTTDIEKVTTNFVNLFDEAKRRLKTTYDNYVNIEGVNANNLKPPPPHDQWKRPPPSSS